MVYNAIWRASSSYAFIYSYEVSMKSAKALPRYGSGYISAGRTAGRTDNAKTISLRLWRGIIKLSKKIYSHDFVILYLNVSMPHSIEVFIVWLTTISSKFEEKA